MANPVKKFAIFAGHGGIDTGAIGIGGIHEDDKNLLVAKECVRLMNLKGHKTITNRTTDVTSDINVKVAYANKENVDAVFDIHLNAYKGIGTGTETFYDHTGGISKTLAEHINKQLVQEGFRDRGVKVKLSSAGNDDYFGVIRLSKAPAVLIEICFIDSASDMAKFNPARAAQAIVDGILEVFPAPVIAKPLVVKPSIPTNLKAVASGTSITISWGKSSNAKGYELWRSTSLTGAITNVYRGIARSFKDTKVSPNTAYYYKAKSYNDNGVISAYSNYTSTVSAIVKPIAKPPIKILKVGSKVQIILANAVYGGASQGIKIGASFKNKTCTVQQMGTTKINPGQVLIKELFSWVYVKDIKII